jgi:hypothetical protein
MGKAHRRIAMIFILDYLIELIVFYFVLLRFLRMLFHNIKYGNFLFTEIGLKTLHCVVR